jgi:hypothetical protein
MWFDMNIIALRITMPRSREGFLRDRRNPPDGFPGHKFVTDEEDLARAYLAALERVQIGHGRFDAILITGDEEETVNNMTKARQLLGWAPLSQRHVDE